MRFFFPSHFDGGNRGCEAISKATAIILSEPKDRLVALCGNVVLDSQLGLGKYVSLKKEVPLRLFDRIRNKLIRVFHLPYELVQYDQYTRFLDRMKMGDVMISTGGDLLCYNNSIVSRTNDYASSLGFKTILWGCSMGPENLTEEKESTLRKFSLIYARESLSYNFFLSLGLKNVCLFPDPAFVLKPELCGMPDLFTHSEVIGINLSSFSLGGYTLDSPFGHEVIRLVEYILEETKYSILLVPHVVWDSPKTHQDDRIVSALIKERFSSQTRISILDINNLNYCQIRYVISKCKFFIGSRTHAVISAYSTCVPTIALSYSIKSKGIAKDLGLPIELIVNSNSGEKGVLINSVKFLFTHEEEIRQQLETVMPEYSQRPYGVMKFVQKTIAN